MNCRDTLATLLDQVDYTAGNCRPNEMVGAVLPKEIVALARESIAEFDKFFKLGMETVDKLIEGGEGNLTMRAADLLELDALPLNEHLPEESGGAFFVHWSCSNCLPDDYDSSDSCHHCGKPRTAKLESR